MKIVLTGSLGPIGKPLTETLVNKDIFVAKANIDGIPYFDRDLER